MCTYAKNTHTWHWVISWKCTHQEPYGSETRHSHTSRWTHSEVICATSCKEVKPELRKLSLYWLILMAASQSSTELKVLTSGMDLSSSGCEGLVQRRTPRAKGWRWNIVGLWCNIKEGLKEKESKADTCVCMWLCQRKLGRENLPMNAGIYLKYF